MMQKIEVRDAIFDKLNDAAKQRGVTPDEVLFCLPFFRTEFVGVVRDSEMIEFLTEYLQDATAISQKEVYYHFSDVGGKGRVRKGLIALGWSLHNVAVKIEGEVLRVWTKVPMTNEEIRFEFLM